MVTDLGVVSLGRDGKLWRKPLGKSKKTWKNVANLRTIGKNHGKTTLVESFWQRNTCYLCIFCRNLFLIHYCQGTNHGKTKAPGAHQGRILLIFFQALKTHWAHFWVEKNWEPSQHQHLQLLISQILFAVYRTGLLIKQGWCTENIQKNQVNRVDFYLGGVGFAFARWVWHKFLPRRSSWAGFA